MPKDEFLFTANAISVVGELSSMVGSAWWQIGSQTFLFRDLQDSTGAAKVTRKIRLDDFVALRSLLLLSHFLLTHTGLFCQISFGNSNFGKTYFFNIFLLETLQDIWYFDILRKKDFFYISNYHIYWLELSYFYHFCSFQHFYLVTQVKDFDINPL